VKFLCDNCKAKYQIADEKVAGKTVRMKCRKCGHQIEVRAAVTETSVASAPPPGPPQAPRPPAPRSNLATSLSATKPRAPVTQNPPFSSGSGSALAGAFQRNVQDAPASLPMGSAGLAAGGSRQIELSVTDEWYVAINGVPVGPVRISELRRKAAAGAVTEDSLCWQEGLEEWRPIRSIPELAQLVREAAQGNRPSLAGPPPPPIPEPGRAPMAPRPPAPQRNSGFAGPLERSFGSTPPPAPRVSEPPRPAAALDRLDRLDRGGRSNVVPLHGRLSSSPSIPGPDRIDDAPHTAPFGHDGRAAHALAPFNVPERAPTPAPPIATPVTDPFAITPAPQPLLPPATASFMPPPPAAPAPTQYVEQKRGVPLWFWPILLLALGFGGGIAFLVFRPQPPQQPVVIQVPAPTQAPADKHDVPSPPTNDPSPPPTTPTPTTTGKVASAPHHQPAPTTGPKIDLGGLGSPGGGPNPGPGGGSTTAGGGGTFDQAAVERVVANHRAGVKRSCWERVSGPDQKSSVNVTVNATVAPNGTVSSTSSSGDDPVVAKCIEGQVRTWTFPPPGETKQIALPFKFVRQ
jgi:predicted Zn finger-like uncharacterized protein